MIGRMFGFGRDDSVAAGGPEAVFVSETGLVRAENQDNVLVAAVRGVFCVADGIGGGAEGAKASATVCHELKLMTHAAGDTLAERVDAVCGSLVDANAAIYEYAAARGIGKMGSTAAVLALDPANRSRAAVVHVGDSRVYRVRGGLVTPLTRDHSAVRDRANPLAHVLTRAIGVQPSVCCDVREVDVRPGDRFVLCTDGVHDVVSDVRLGVFASVGNLESAASRIADEVVRRGAPDNYSFVLVET